MEHRHRRGLRIAAGISVVGTTKSKNVVMVGPPPLKNRNGPFGTFPAHGSLPALDSRVRATGQEAAARPFNT
jgi:hypothetical protein